MADEASARTMGSIDETQLSSALGSMLAALDEQTSPLAALLGASTGGPPPATSNLPAPTEPIAEPSGPTRGATAAMGEGVRVDELLVRAASRGDLAMVRSLLDRGAVAAARNHHLLTALHWAVTLGHAQVVELLLERGAPLDTQDAEGHTPLHMAAREGDEEMVTLLLEKGADSGRTSSAGRTPLALALIFAEDELGCISALRRAEAEANARARIRGPNAAAAHAAAATRLDAIAGVVSSGPRFVTSSAGLSSLGIAPSPNVTGGSTGADAGNQAAGVSGGEGVKKPTLILDVTELSAAAAAALGAAATSTAAAASSTAAPAPPSAAAAPSANAVSCGCGPDEPMFGSELPQAPGTEPASLPSAGQTAASGAACSPPASQLLGRSVPSGALAGDATGAAARSVEEEMARLVLLHHSLRPPPQAQPAETQPAGPAEARQPRRTVVLDFADPFANSA